MAAPKGNKYAIGNNGGRPRLFTDPKKLEKKVIEYFDYIQGEEGDTITNKLGEQVKTWIREPESPTVTGLALFLGFADRTTLYEYRDREEFSFIIKRAISIVENHHEHRLGSTTPTGSIFALKNMGWKDRQETTIITEDHASDEEIDERLAEIEGKLDNISPDLN